MDKHLFMDMLRVAFDDYLAEDPDLDGIILITVKKDKHDDLVTQLGTTIAPQTLEFILTRLLDSLATGATLTHVPQKNTFRKAL